MSLWQRPQLWLVMKKVDGMVRLTFVLDDDGKKGLLGPAPSCSIASGGVVGFSIRYAPRQRASRLLRTTLAATAPAASTKTAARSASRTRAVSSNDSRRHQEIASSTAP